MRSILAMMTHLAASTLLANVCLAQPSTVSSGQVAYAIAIHGGAGSAPTDDSWIKNRSLVLERALRAGQNVLANSGTSLDAVENVIRILEDSPYFNAGKGAVYNAAGSHELDASIMDGRTRSCGAVGGVRTVRNPISLARRVMTDTRHVLLVTDGAEKFAAGIDDPRIEIVTPDYFSTDYQHERWRRQRAAQVQQSDAMGTVGCVALDRFGNLAAGTSTGGLTGKRYGRLGDTPIVGAGTYADNDTCAVSCTGIGEDFIRHAVAYDVSARMKYRGESLHEALRAILNHPKYRVRGGVIAVSRTGEMAMQYNTEGMARGAADAKGRWEIHVSK